MSDIYYEVSRDYTTSIYYHIGKNDCINHFHQQLELLYVEKGEVNVIINNEKKVLLSGDLVVVDSFDNHLYSHQEDSISHCLSIPIHYLKRYTAILSAKSLKEKYFSGEKAQEIFNKMMDVVNSLDKNELIIEGSVQILLGTIINDNLNPVVNKTNYDLIKSILMYIEDNYKTAITLDTIAKHFGYSKYYFSHLFNKCFRCNLNDYLNFVRCRYSISCVIDEHMSVADAAFASGFVSMRTYYRTFKKCYNMTPKDFFHSN